MNFITKIRHNGKAPCHCCVGVASANKNCTYEAFPDHLRLGWIFATMSHYCPNLVDTSVITSDSRIILPWTIIQFNDSYSIMEFFYEGVNFRLKDDDCVLHAAFIGHKKHNYA